jgi:hypothetical protein
MAALPLLVLACGSEGSKRTSDDSGRSGSLCEQKTIDASSIDENTYSHLALDWSREDIDCRLGPDFSSRHSGEGDSLSLAYEPEHRRASDGYLCATYELSGTCEGNCDYGSTSGQVLYFPDESQDPGLDRVQTYGYEDGVICESPQAGTYLGGPHPDPAIGTWEKALGESIPRPIGFAQTEMVETNGGILVFANGLIGATGNQTSGTTYPYARLPPHKIPTAVALSGYNEFAFVSVMDTEHMRGQVAVFALRSLKPEAFSIPYFALPNEAGFVGIHLMGFVDLPELIAPTAIAVSGNNGGTPGGHAIGNEFSDLRDPAKRAAFSRDDDERWVANSGQAVVLSKWENAITFLDLRPLFQFVRSAYFGSEETFNRSVATDPWPYDFDSHPEALPVVVRTLSVQRPTVARIGNQIGAFPKGLQTHLNAFVANEAGEIRLFDVTAFSSPERPVPPDSVHEYAKVQAGYNVTSMTVTRNGSFNRSLVVNSRADRVIQWITVGETSVDVVRELSDARIADPVSVDVNDRGPIVTLVDFAGKRLLSYRTGPTENNGGKPPVNYGCGEGGSDTECSAFEFAGALAYPGTPFFLATSNVN